MIGKTFITEPCPTCGHPRGVLNGQCIRNVRKNLGLGLREAAGMLRISPAYLSDMERNKRTINRAMEVRLERFFDGLAARRRTA